MRNCNLKFVVNGLLLIFALQAAIVSKGKIYTYEGMLLRNEVHAGDGFILLKSIVPPGELV